MIFLDYLKNDSQSTKWGRVRVNYSLLEQVIQAKEYMDLREQKSKSKLKVKTVIGF